MRFRPLALLPLAVVVCLALPGRTLPQTTPAQMTAAPPRRFELSAFGGWATSSDVSGSGATLSIGDATSFGATFGLLVPRDTRVQLKWVYYEPRAQLRGPLTSNHFNVATNYFLIEGEKGIRRDRVEPFLSGALGTVVYSPGSFDLGATHYSPSTTWRVAFGLGGGVKLFLNERFALRFAAELLAPIFFSSAGFYVGTGGSGMTASGGVPTVTGNFTLGLTIRL
jgi:hypothetical protein